MPKIITLTPNPTFDFAVDADFVEPNRKLRCKNPEIHPGGGGINVARAALRLGADVLAIFTAGGPYGESLKEAVLVENVPMRIVPIAGDTRIAFHVQDLKEDGEYRFNLPGAEMSKEEADAMISALAEETSAGDYVVGSGSLPPGAPKDFWASAARVAKENGGRFILDSISGVEEALNEGVFILRQNKHEYPAIAGGELSWPEGLEEFARDLVSKGGAERVILSHGGDGSIMATKDKLYRVGAVKVKAHSAVGAGDSFVAGVTVSLLQGRDNDDALNYGMSAAAATRMTQGTSLFKPEDVERLYEIAHTL